jgi:hypothetical protein
MGNEIEIPIHTCTHVTEYYSAFQKKEILPFVTMWMNPEDIILSILLDPEKKPLYNLAYMRNLKQSNS